MASSAFDHSAVNALNRDARRAHMNAFFMHLGLWDSAKVAQTREKCVEKYCQFLGEQGYTSINQEYFEYQVDSLVWHNVLKRGKVLTKDNEWPWTDTVPNKQDLATQPSSAYREWLSRKSEVNGEGDRVPTPPRLIVLSDEL
ncbi:hypothetical protein FPCIR_12749 [Fusarium pseudocircinatum]|uniref:Uncharacterized protein n=1 Tax=Fusarium pseudocircinatum TaxID=56676 RepID=A0A8H5KPM4_9HYPO|nr:hypothetical protein FPCIR_12749 [Fusarium pseudocircinatum]